MEKNRIRPDEPGNSREREWGNASNMRVVLHEFCRTLLFAQLGSPNFGFDTARAIAWPPFLRPGFVPAR